MRHANLALAAILSLAVVGAGSQVLAQTETPAPAPGGGYGYMGPGMMGGYGYGPGMMGGYGPGMMGYGGGYGPMMRGYGMGGYGMGPWMMGPAWNRQQALNLSTDDVTQYFQRWLAWQGNPHLKLGKVAASGDDTITADIVTKDGDALVQRFVVDRHTGAMRAE